MLPPTLRVLLNLHVLLPLPHLHHHHLLCLVSMITVLKSSGVAACMCMLGVYACVCGSVYVCVYMCICVCLTLCMSVVCMCIHAFVCHCVWIVGVCRGRSLNF